MQGKYGFLFSVAERAGSPKNAVSCQKLVNREEDCAKQAWERRITNMR
jgi:hypothetical protein